MINSFDATLYHLINQEWISPVLDFLMVKISDKYTWIPLYMVIIWLITKEFKKKSILILIALALSVVLSDRFTSGVMKPAFKRPRPCHEISLSPRLPAGISCSETGSMASSHAANHFAVAVFLIILYGLNKRANMIFWLTWASVVSYSRVYCGVHYPTDVLVGALVGMIFGALSFYLYSKSLKLLKWE